MDAKGQERGAGGVGAPHSEEELEEDDRMEDLPACCGVGERHPVRGPLPGAGLSPGDRASELEPLEAWVFSNEMGGPLNKSNLRQRVFHRCLAKASLRRILLHDLRHTYASILLGRGESPVSVKEQMGHHSIKVTGDGGHPGTSSQGRTRRLWTGWTSSWPQPTATPAQPE